MQVESIHNIFRAYDIRGIVDKTLYYHDAYFEFYGIKYYIVNTWRVSALTQLLKGIINLQIKNLRHPFSFIYLSIKSLKNPIEK